MIINKITTGFVIQAYDTKTQTWTKQEFVAGNECDYEDKDGNPVDSEIISSGDEPYLPFEMVQPK